MKQPLIEANDPITASRDPHQLRCHGISLQGLSDSRYRVGRLDFTNSLTDEHLKAIDERHDGTPGGWRVHEPVDMVLHPEKGAILVAHCAVDPAHPEYVIRRRVEQIHTRLVDLQRKIRRRLDESDFWRDRPIVLGIGITVCAVLPDDAIPPHIPPEVICDCSTPGGVERHLEQLFDFFATPASTPIAAYGRRLVSDLTDSPGWIGTFFDESELHADSRRRLGHRHSDPKVA